MTRLEIEDGMPEHLTIITKTKGFRYFENVQLLNQTAEYIFSVFSQYWYRLMKLNK